MPKRGRSEAGEVRRKFKKCAHDLGVRLPSRTSPTPSIYPTGLVAASSPQTFEIDNHNNSRQNPKEVVAASSPHFTGIGLEDRVSQTQDTDQTDRPQLGCKRVRGNNVDEAFSVGSGRVSDGNAGRACGNEGNDGISDCSSECTLLGPGDTFEDEVELVSGACPSIALLESHHT